MRLRKPNSPQEWKALCNRLEGAEADEFGIGNEEQFEEFQRLARKALGTTPLVVASLLGSAPAWVLIVTQMLLHTTQWGTASLGLASLAIFAAQGIEAYINRGARNNAIVLGSTLGLFE